MNDPIGWIGLGKLGLPCALALAKFGEVPIIGHDTNPEVAEILAGRTPFPHREEDIDRYLGYGGIELTDSIDDLVTRTDLVFLAVPTPHESAYGGELPMPASYRDFDYSTLRHVAWRVAAACERHDREITLVVVSTVLPGTMRREIIPALGPLVKLVYNPFFIAMGTTIEDFLHPEFVLIGTGQGAQDDAKPLVELYRRIHSAPIRLMSYESAELTKVAYNTYISTKITFANTLMEICDGIPGADVDDVCEALKIGRDRITSGAYLSAGMGDGGACHPRDNIAMAWLAQRLGLSADPFTYVTRAREAQTRALANRVREISLESKLPVVVLGKTYKPNTDLTAGSPALLLSHYLDEGYIDHELWDPHLDSEQPYGVVWPKYPAVYVIATRHEVFTTWQFPMHSIVVDPFRYIDDQPSVTVIRIGEGRY